TDRHPCLPDLPLNGGPFARDAVALDRRPRARDALPLRHEQRAQSRRERGGYADPDQISPQGRIATSDRGAQRRSHRGDAGRLRTVGTNRVPARRTRLGRRGAATAVQADAAVAWTWRIERSAAGTPHD